MYFLSKQFYTAASSSLTLVDDIEFLIQLDILKKCVKNYFPFSFSQMKPDLFRIKYLPFTILIFWMTEVFILLNADTKINNFKIKINIYHNYLKHNLPDLMMLSSR